MKVLELEWKDSLVGPKSTSSHRARRIRVDRDTRGCPLQFVMNRYDEQLCFEIGSALGVMNQNWGRQNTQSLQAVFGFSPF